MTDSLDQARERRAGLRSTIDNVEWALSRPAYGPMVEWCGDLGDQLRRMSFALDQHVAVTEGPDGLLADILESAPRLSNRIERARQDHVRLRAQLDAVLGSLPVEPAAVDKLRDEVVDLLAALVRHRQTGADLVYEAYHVDIDAAD